MFLGPPGDVPETPRDAPGTPQDLQEHLMDHKNGRISTNGQRQKLSIAVFEAAREGPSHERLNRAVDRAVLSIKRPPKLIIGGLVPLMEDQVVTLKAQILT